VASSSSHAEPEKAEAQLLGRSRHQYQSRFGLSLEERDSTNHGCSSDVWLTTRSMISRMPRPCTSSSRPSKVSSVPNVGSMSW
jgi:hypothetical protein